MSIWFIYSLLRREENEAEDFLFVFSIHVLLASSLRLTPPSFGFLLVPTNSSALTILLIRLRPTLFLGICSTLCAFTVIRVVDYLVVNCKWVCISSSLSSFEIRQCIVGLARALIRLMSGQLFWGAFCIERLCSCSNLVSSQIISQYKAPD